MKSVKHNGHDSESLKKKALSVSVKEGTVANISANIGDNNIIPFALLLNAKPIHIGMLSSFSGFLYQLAQFVGIKMMNKLTRKKIVLWFVLFQSIMWLFIAATGVLVFRGVFDGYSIWMLILFYSLLMFFGGIAYPAWFSWMGDIVNPEEKGKYFSSRNRTATFFGLIALLAASFFLDYYKTKGIALLAFSVLFALAFAFRFASFLLFHRQYAPKFRAKRRDYFSFWAFIKRLDNFGKFAVYHGFFNFAVMVASPFFNVYMLQELGFSYKIFAVSLVSYYIYYLIFLPIAGKFSDKYGNRRLTVITNVFFMLTPILYCFVKTPLSVILIPQLSSGIASAASVISFSNFVYDSVSQRHRAICMTYTNFIIGIGTLVGSLVGGLIVSYFHPSGISPYIFVFIVAAVLRGLVAVIFLPHIKEVRKVKRAPASYTFFMHPLNSLHIITTKLTQVPGTALGKFKSLRLFTH